MPRHCSTTPISRLHRFFSASTSPAPPSRSWSPDAAFAAATERTRAGTLSSEDAHKLFDELLRQATQVDARSLDGFLAALAHVRDSASCRDGPALAIALYNRVRREEASPGPTVFTYGILMNCCCRTGRPELGLSLFGLLLKTPIMTNVIVANTLLKCLCQANRTDEAVSVLLHRLSDLGCVPDAYSYNTVLKGLCADRRSQRALDLIQIVRKEGGGCSLGVVAYNTVIHGFFKEGEVSKACNLFHEMMQHGIVPDVFTYNSVIDALCKARAMDKAGLFLRQMVDNSVQPNKVKR